MPRSETEQIVDEGLLEGEFLFWNHQAIPGQTYVGFERISGDSEHVITRNSFGHTWEIPLSNAVHRITPRVLLVENLSGVTSDVGRGRRRVRIRASASSPVDLSTLVHEGIHFFTSNAFKALVESLQSQQLEIRNANGTSQPAFRPAVLPFANGQNFRPNRAFRLTLRSNSLALLFLIFAQRLFPLKNGHLRK